MDDLEKMNENDRIGPMTSQGEFFQSDHWSHGIMEGVKRWHSKYCWDDLKILVSISRVAVFGCFSHLLRTFRDASFSSCGRLLNDLLGGFCREEWLFEVWKAGFSSQVRLTCHLSKLTGPTLLGKTLQLLAKKVTKLAIWNNARSK